MKQIEKSYETTGAHEIGHTLKIVPNNEHSQTDIMTAHPTDPNRGTNISQQNINNMINAKRMESIPIFTQIINSFKNLFK